MVTNIIWVRMAMKYKFSYHTTAFDFWQLFMYYIYGSIVGVCNIIFTVAILLLTVKFWDDVSYLVRAFLIIACCLFTVIQPIGIYIRSKKQVATIPKDMEIGFDDYGIHVHTKSQSSDLKWNTIKRISKKPNMIIIFSTTTHGFVLTNRVLGEQKEKFYNYIVSKIGK